MQLKSFPLNNLNFTAAQTFQVKQYLVCLKHTEEGFHPKRLCGNKNLIIDWCAVLYNL